MWNSHTISELEADFSRIINSEVAVCFIKYLENKPIEMEQEL